jgi:hypothetical protein
MASVGQSQRKFLLGNLKEIKAKATFFTDEPKLTIPPVHDVYDTRSNMQSIVHGPLGM